MVQKQQIQINKTDPNRKEKKNNTVPLGIPGGDFGSGTLQKLDQVREVSWGVLSHGHGIEMGFGPFGI